MNVQSLLQAALASALRGRAGLTATAFDAPPLRAARPYAVVEDAVLGDWGTKDMAGREGRVAIALFDGGESPRRLRLLAGEAEEAVLAMPRTIGGGWALVVVTLLRSRITREGEGQWKAVSEFRLRMLRSEI